MKVQIVGFMLLFVSFAEAQKVIPLYKGKAPGSESWAWQEAEMYSDSWQTRIVYNVSAPTLTAYLPPAATANGTAVVVLPGGGFHALSIDSEGIEVAKWLNSKGVAAFVLKYRLVKSETNDPVQELSAKMADRKTFDEENLKLIPLAIADGLQAIKLLRREASRFKINPRRIGLIGFSAGATITTGVALEADPEGRPDFIAPIYPYLPAYINDKRVPGNAPPMFIAAATDDQLGLAPHSISLYTKWVEAGNAAELHLYSLGGHGFGMRTQQLPSDSWIERFGDWMQIQGLFLPSDPAHPLSRALPGEILQREKETHEKLHNDWANLQRYREENKKLGLPRAGEDRVVFMGNSITAGWIHARPEFFASKSYVNRGIGGQTTPQMLIRFKQDVIDLNPEVVVILAGINDIARNTGPTTLQAIMDNISGMALLAKSYGIKVVLSSVLPAFDFPWRPGLEPAGKVIALNAMIRKFAAENNMVYLDYFPAMADKRSGMKAAYSRDEVHPTVEGYKVMEPLVEKAIKEALQKE